MKELSEYAPHDIYSEEEELPIYHLDEIDTVTLLEDCYLLLSRIILLKGNAKWLQSDAVWLTNRLDESISWIKFH